jgi:chromosome partitioning protein
MGGVAAVLDMDPQGTTMRWGKRREATSPLFAAVDISTIGAEIDRMRQAGVSWLFLDLPGRAAAMGAGCREAHLILVPSRPTDIDLEASDAAVMAARRLNKPYAFVLNMVPTQANSTRAAGYRSTLEAAGHPVCPCFIKSRLSVADALAVGLGVSEFEPKGAAAAEFRSLFEWIDAHIDAGERSFTNVA